MVLPERVTMLRWWALFHVMGDENFARYLKSRSAKTREGYKNTFSTVGIEGFRSDLEPEAIHQTEFPEDARHAQFAAFCARIASN